MTVSTKKVLAIASHIEQLAVLKIALGTQTNWKISTAVDAGKPPQRTRS